MDKTKLKVFGERLAEVLYPLKCPICDEIVSNRELRMCESCYKKLSFVKEPVCKKCGRMLIDERKEYCTECEKEGHLRKRYFDKGISLLEHDEYTKKIIYDLKYSNRRENAAFLAKELKNRKGNVIKDWKMQVLIPVPLHIKRQQARGFNQAELLAKQMSKLMNIGVDTKLLERYRHTTPQKELDKKKRKKNIENSFKIKNNIVKYKYAILVDDIYTTGATIEECAKVLKAAGVKEVNFITMSIVSS